MPMPGRIRAAAKARKAVGATQVTFPLMLPSGRRGQAAGAERVGAKLQRSRGIEPESDEEVGNKEQTLPIRRSAGSFLCPKSLSEKTLSEVEQPPSA